MVDPELQTASVPRLFQVSRDALFAFKVFRVGLLLHSLRITIPANPDLRLNVYIIHLPLYVVV